MIHIFCIILGLYTYLWTCVASYYAELRDGKETEEECSGTNRSYLTPSAVTNPDAFSELPPKYDNVVGVDNPGFQEMPPKYEEVTEKKSP